MSFSRPAFTLYVLVWLTVNTFPLHKTRPLMNDIEKTPFIKEVSAVSDSLSPQKTYVDLCVVLILTTLTYLIAGYFDLAERYIDWTALGEWYQLDEIVFVLLVGCLGLVWFSLRRLKELTKTLTHNLDMHEQLKKHHAHIKQLLKQNQALINHMMLVRESERHHLATELHDVFGQYLAAMDANLTVAKQLTPADNEKLQQVIQSVIDSTTHLREITRNKLRSLKPPTLESLGFSGAVVELISDWQQTFPDITVMKQLKIHDESTDEQTALALYRALQEGLVNVSRHAEASRVEIQLLQQPNATHASYTLILDDDGKGMDVDLTVSNGLGLLGIRERCRDLGGDLNISPSPIGGTRLTVNIGHHA
jgi:signal transduction histidine kinase